MKFTCILPELVTFSKFQLEDKQIGLHNVWMHRMFRFTRRRAYSQYSFGGSTPTGNNRPSLEPRPASGSGGALMVLLIVCVSARVSG